MSKREIDLGRLLQRVGRRIEDEGQVTSQRLHDWKRVEQVESDSSRGGGGGVTFKVADRQQDRQAASMSAEWVRIRLQLGYLAERAGWLMDQAKAEHRPLDRHRTPAQVEAEGWCGNHWSKIGELVPISLRPTGEPWYRGRCRRCGGWPDGDPPREVLLTWRDGRSVKVRAS